MRAFACLSILTVALVGAPARAQSSDPAAAEALFNAGRAAFDRGDYAIACAKFEESQRLDPGAGTLINLAACREKLGRLSGAWDAWRQAQQALGPNDDRSAQVAARVAALEKRLPSLEIRLSANAPDGSRIERDGLALGSASYGVSLPVDPGRHVVIVSAPEFAPRRYEISLAETERRMIEVEPGAPENHAPGEAQLSGDQRRGSATPAATSTKRTLGFMIGGVGVAGIVVGSVTGLFALRAKSDMLDNCDAVSGGFDCNQDGAHAASSGKTFATISTIGFAAGVVGLGVGGYLVLSSGPTHTAFSAHPLPGGGAVGLGRAF